MSMCVDETRHDGLAGEIEHARVRSNERLDRLIASDGDELSIHNCERLRARPVRVHRDDVRMTDDQFSRSSTRNANSREVCYEK